MWTGGAEPDKAAQWQGSGQITTAKKAWAVSLSHKPGEGKTWCLSHFKEPYFTFSF